MVLRGGVPLVAGVAVLAVLAWWFGLGGVVAALRTASPRRSAARTWRCPVAVLALQAGRWRLMAAAVGAPADFGRGSPRRAWPATASASLLPLARVAGDPLRAVLARRGDVRLSSASAGVAIDRLLELIGNMLAVTVYLAIFSAAAVGASSPRTSLRDRRRACSRCWRCWRC